MAHPLSEQEGRKEVATRYKYQSKRQAYHGRDPLCYNLHSRASTRLSIRNPALPLIDSIAMSKIISQEPLTTHDAKWVRLVK